MSINELITGSTPSSETTPGGDISEIVVEQGEPGKIWLQAKCPGGNWVNITNQSGVFALATADPLMTYRFRPENISASIRVYFS